MPAPSQSSRLLRTGTKSAVWTTVGFLAFFLAANISRLFDNPRGRDVIATAGIVTTVVLLSVLMRATSKIADSLSDSEFAAATIQLRLVSSGIILLLVASLLSAIADPDGRDVRELLGDLISIILFGGAVLLLGNGVSEYQRAKGLVRERSAR